MTLDKSDWRSLRSGFIASVARGPDDPALVVGKRTFSFAQIDDRARRWAHAILDSLDRPARRVGVFAHRSEVAYTGTMAALMSGAAFVPLNKQFPPERTARMAKAAELDAIIVDKGSLPKLADVLCQLERPPIVLSPDEGTAPTEGAGRWLSAEDLAAFAPRASLPAVVEDEIAYLLFTSGSTGTPKGVPVAHRNVLHFIDVMVERYGIRREDRFSQTFDQTFDLSIFDIFVAWERGACVCAMQPLDRIAPGQFVNKNQVSVWFSVPSIPALMRKKNTLKPGLFPTLRWSLFCGEPLPRATAEAWLAAAPESSIENLYGPTELTIACLLHRWDPERSPALCENDLVPIGAPYPGLGAIVLAEDGTPVDPGEAGELCVCGPQTTPGYWRDPQKTAERFFVSERPETEGLRFYRTGDRARQLDSGDYVYLGRVDHQVQVLGHRVELGEIEAVLRRGAGVVEAVAVGWPIVEGTIQGTVAFVSGSAPDPEQIIAEARAQLPDYMIPKRVIVVDQMPLNANGKIDRNALVARLEAR